MSPITKTCAVLVMTFMALSSTVVHAGTQLQVQFQRWSYEGDASQDC
jgi:hypothetical protein